MDSHQKPFLHPSRFDAQKPHFLRFAKFIPPTQNYTWSIQVKSLDVDGIVRGESQSQNPANSDVNFDALSFSFGVFVLCFIRRHFGHFSCEFWIFGPSKDGFSVLGDKGMVWQCVVLVAGVLVGARLLGEGSGGGFANQSISPGQ